MTVPALAPVKRKGLKQVLRELAREYDHDQLGDVAGSLAYAGFLSLFPFLLFLVALASRLASPGMIENLLNELARFAPPQVTQLVAERISALQKSQSGGLLTLSVIGAIGAASGGISALMSALNRAYHVADTRPWWKVRGIAILATFAAWVLAVLASAIAVAVPAVAKAIGGPMGTFIDWMRLPVAGLMIVVLFSLLYHFLPNRKRKYRVFTPGAVFGAAIWLLASWGFSMYVRHFASYEAVYGALGGVIVLLFWMWVTSQGLLLGAELNKILEEESANAHATAPTVGEAPAAGAQAMMQAGAGPAAAPPETARRPRRRADPATLLVGAALALGAFLIGQRLSPRRF